jgi:O-succinylbenzoate synthase
VALGIPPDYRGEVLKTWVGDALGRGYRRIKLKVRPGWDLEPVALAREVMRDTGREVPLWVDANGAYRFDQDMQSLQKLDDQGLLFVEQPFPEDAIWDAREAERQLKTPICLDESLVSPDVARQVVAMGGPKIWNVKIQRVGGLEAACRIYQHAMAAEVKLWGGTMPESGLGAQAMLALGGQAGFVYPSDIEPSERWYAPHSDLIELEMDAEGRMAVPTQHQKPCLPPDANLVAELTV